jgi:hypothetical protein
VRWALVALVAASGCVVRGRYRVESPPVDGVVAARRLKDGAPVRLRADSIRTVDAAGIADTSCVSPRVTAGSILTWIGSAISIAGTVLVFATDGAPRTAGFVLAPSAEPIMITGTVLWILGLRHPPQELP